MNSSASELSYHHCQETPEFQIQGNLIYLTLGSLEQMNESAFNGFQVFSDPFEKYGRFWRAVIEFHRIQSKKFIGFYLDCACDDDYQWPYHIQAQFVLRNQSNKEDIIKLLQLSYNQNESKGDPRFVLYDDLVNVDNGFYKNLRAYFYIEFAHNMSPVGLKNQGATCYLNSLLQVLFFIKKFRKAVFQMPAQCNLITDTVSSALQYLFFKLQHSNKAISTKILTASFGWDDQQCQHQRDVQETFRLLLDQLEKEMKDTPLEDTIPSLFRGSMITRINCLKIPYTSETVATFDDLQLKVEDMIDLESSFKHYMAVEYLKGANQYHAGKNGLQDAQKSVIFSELPPVLCLHLMRFKYDSATENYTKINDYLPYPYILDLEKLLEKRNKIPAQYFLFAVIVHSGIYGGGHYFAYINPEGNNNWFKFNDEAVTNCSSNDALDVNYSDASPCSSYILIYIAQTARQNVLCPILESDIPLSLKKRLTRRMKKVSVVSKNNQAVSPREPLLSFNCSFVDQSDLRQMSKRLVCVKPTEQVFDILAKSRAYLQLIPGGSGKLRLLEISDNRIQKILPDSVVAATLYENVTGVLRVEEIPVDEVVVLSDEMIIFVMQFYEDIANTTGAPFTIKLKDKTTLRQLRKNIQMKLKLDDSSVNENWRLTLIKPNVKHYFDDNESETTVISLDLFTDSNGALHRNCENAWLGLDHSPASKRSKFDHLIFS